MKSLWMNESMWSWKPATVFSIQFFSEVFLVSEAAEQQLQCPDDGLHATSAQLIRTDVSLPKAPDGSHPTTHIPERVYLRTCTEKKETWSKAGYISGKKSSFQHKYDN